MPGIFTPAGVYLRIHSAGPPLSICQIPTTQASMPVMSAQPSSVHAVPACRARAVASAPACRIIFIALGGKYIAFPLLPDDDYAESGLLVFLRKRGSLLAALCPRKTHVHGRSSPLLALDLHAAAHILHKGMNLRQPKPCPPLAFRREE